MRISVVIPVFNEAELLPRALRSIEGARDVEIVVVDGGSTDGTIETLEPLSVSLLHSERCRALQMNRGAAKAGGDALVFLHADTRLPPGFDRIVRETLAGVGVAGGAFRLSIEAPGRAIRWIERLANWRAGRLQMPYGDQALFVSAATFRAIGGFPELPFMEDFELVRRLRRRGRIAVSSHAVRTSGRRWRRLGPWRTTLLNQVAVVAYLLGVDPARIGRWYHRPRTGKG